VPELEKIRRQVLRGRKMDDVMESYDWAEFERIVGDIFRQNDFRVTNNFRFRTWKRWEVDLIASRGSTVFCVDCKRWSQGRSKRWSLAKAAREQASRTREFDRFVRSNPETRGMMGIPDGVPVPIVATLHEEEIVKEGQTFVVPVEKLNSFILHSDELF